jgi:hypothetical protein
MEHCKACFSDMPPGATKCKECQSLQTETKDCDLCGQLIPKSARRCNLCSAYQGGLQHLALVASLASVVTLIGSIIAVFVAIEPIASYIHDLTSHTRFKLMRATGDMARGEPALLHLNVWNTGRKPSAIVGYRLKLGTLPVDGLTFQDVQLERFPDDTNVIQQGGTPVPIRLRIRELTLIQRGTGQPYAKDDLIELLKNEQVRKSRVILEVDVEESNDPRAGHYWNKIHPRPFHKRSDTFPLENIATFIKGSMSG